MITTIKAYILLISIMNPGGGHATMQVIGGFQTLENCMMEGERGRAITARSPMEYRYVCLTQEFSSDSE